MDGATFVAALLADNETLLGKLAPTQTLTAECGKELSVRKLLKLALRNELEASEIAALWMPLTGDVELKLGLARQAGDEARHYRLIEMRLRQLGENFDGFSPLGEGYSLMFQYLRGLKSGVEWVAAGMFTREAIALTKNQQFIEFCEHSGDKETANLYREVIQVDERFHHELGARFLKRLAVTSEAQDLARAARERTIDLAEELQTLAYRTRKIHHAPGC